VSAGRRKSRQSVKTLKVAKRPSLGCYTPMGVPKRQFETKEAAMVLAREQGRNHAYFCRHCRHWHIGAKR
jgi:hypothetical protein